MIQLCNTRLRLAYYSYFDVCTKESQKENFNNGHLVFALDDLERQLNYMALRLIPTDEIIKEI